MKKKIIGVILLSVIALLACACNGKDKNNSDVGNLMYDDTDFTDVDYYGCPTSKRIKKLNLKKNRV